MRSGRKSAGFTFFELMFAIALFGLNFHLIYSQVMDGLRRMKRVKDRQEVIQEMNQHLRLIHASDYQEVKTSIIELRSSLKGYDAQQIVVLKRPGLKLVEILVDDKVMNQRLVRMFTYKANPTVQGS